MSVRRRLFRTKKSMESLYLGKPADKDFEKEVYQSTKTGMLFWLADLGSPIVFFEAPEAQGRVDHRRCQGDAIGHT